MQTVKEGELEFRLPDAVKVCKLDTQTPGQPQPVGMSLVDLVLTETERCLLVEIKDPAATGATEAQQAAILVKARSGDWISHQIVPKMRDSYTYQHLMGQDARPFLAVLLLGWKCYPNDCALLMTLQDKLKAGVRGETGVDWVRQYVTGAVVLTVDGWNKQFPDYPIVRFP
jgi:hypothetical protein